MPHVFLLNIPSNSVAQSMMYCIASDVSVQTMLYDAVLYLNSV